MLGVAFAFGLSLLVMAYAVGPISGCHINPAVTLGLLVRGKIAVPEAARYWAAQVLGAIVAAGILLAIVESRKAGYDAGADGLGANGYGDHSPGGYPWEAAFVVEVLLTGFLVFAVLATTDRIAAVAFAGIPIGLGSCSSIWSASRSTTRRSTRRAASGRRSSSVTGRSSSCGCSSSPRSSERCWGPECTRRYLRAATRSTPRSPRSRPTPRDDHAALSVGCAALRGR